MWPRQPLSGRCGGVGGRRPAIHSSSILLLPRHHGFLSARTGPDLLAASAQAAAAAAVCPPSSSHSHSCGRTTASARASPSDFFRRRPGPRGDADGGAHQAVPEVRRPVPGRGEPPDRLRLPRPRHRYPVGSSAVLVATFCFFSFITLLPHFAGLAKYLLGLVWWRPTQSHTMPPQCRGPVVHLSERAVRCHGNATEIL
jgi:hypothetical protein